MGAETTTLRLGTGTREGVPHPPAMQETPGCFLGREDPLEKG